MRPRWPFETGHAGKPRVAAGEASLMFRLTDARLQLTSGENHAHRMRTAIVHYWLLGMRGGEKVVEALCRLLPGADIFTLFYDPEKVSPLIRSRRVTASFLNPLRSYYRSL